MIILIPLTRLPSGRRLVPAHVILLFEFGFLSLSGFQTWSLSEITLTGRGHSRPSFGSLYNSPPSVPGV